jgi:hypothetical protein
MFLRKTPPIKLVISQRSLSHMDRSLYRRDRDYSVRGASLIVEVYEDCLEIINPGGLPQS